MSGGIGLGQQELLDKHLTNQWQTTAQIAESYNISGPSERNERRTMVCSLDGLVTRGRVLKERDYNEATGRVVARWKLNADYVAPAVTKTPTKKAHVSKKAVKTVSKTPSRHTIENGEKVRQVR